MSLKNQRRKYQASFAGYFPADNPKYSCVVVVDDPKVNGTHGASVAGPIFKRIIDHTCVQVTSLLEPVQEIVHVDGREDDVFTIGYGPDLKWISEELDLVDGGVGKVPAWAVLKSEEEGVVFQNKSLKRNAIPNVRGMGARDAMYMLESCGLRVVMKGQGKVRKQSIQPGTIAKGQKIYVDLG